MSAIDAAKPSILVALFKSKAWSNAELLDAMLQLDASTQNEHRHLAIRIMNHTYVVDQIFRAQLQGEAHHFAATNTETTPTLPALTAAIAQGDAWFAAYISGLSSAELNETIKFKFTDGDTGTMTREEILHHLIAHGNYHRGAVGRILGQLSIAPPRDLFTRFLHQVEPVRRNA
jgi:uncharacterized damage-inducible protein DinB